MADLVDKFVSACGYPFDAHLVKAIIDAGVDVNAENSEGLTGMHVACGGCIIAPMQEVLVDFLLRHPKLDPNKTSSGWCVWCKGRDSTPLHCAFVYGHIGVKKKVIANPKMTGLNAKNSYGTPIMVALDNRRDETVKEMEIEGIDLKTKNRWGRSLVQQARYGTIIVQDNKTLNSFTENNIR
jgi:hypothetical protein